MKHVSDVLIIYHLQITLQRREYVSVIPYYHYLALLIVFISSFIGVFKHKSILYSSVVTIILLVVPNILPIFDVNEKKVAIIYAIFYAFNAVVLSLVVLQLKRGFLSSHEKNLEL